MEFAVDTRPLGSVMPLASSVVDFSRDAFEAQVAKVKALLGDENLARVIVATARGQIQELQRFFRVSTVHFAWSTEDGVSIDFDYQNFIEARADVAPVKLNPVLSNIKQLEVR